MNCYQVQLRALLLAFHKSYATATYPSSFPYFVWMVAHASPTEYGFSKSSEKRRNSRALAEWMSLMGFTMRRLIRTFDDSDVRQKDKES